MDLDNLKSKKSTFISTNMMWTVGDLFTEMSSHGHVVLQSIHFYFGRVTSSFSTMTVFKQKCQMVNNCKTKENCSSVTPVNLNNDML